MRVQFRTKVEELVAKLIRDIDDEAESSEEFTDGLNTAISILEASDIEEVSDELYDGPGNYLDDEADDSDDDESLFDSLEFLELEDEEKDEGL